MRKLLWVEADRGESWEERKRSVKTAIEAGADAVLVKPEDVERTLELGMISIATSELTPNADVVMLKVGSPNETEQILGRARELRGRGKRVAALVEISNKELEYAAIEVGGKVDFLIVVTPDWKIIPLENLIAELQHVGVKILAKVKSADEAKVATETLEIGATGVLLDTGERGVEEILKARKVLDQLMIEKVELVPARITEVRSVGIGDRACVDTTVLMGMGEGMLVGSQAKGMFLVHSETLSTEFVEPRPFRVNAGAVHAYILLPGGKTKYLSELSAGDEVLIVNTKGEARTAMVGRVKIERRPLVLVEAEFEGEKFKTLLQNAETINLVGNDGKPISIAKLKPDQEVLIHIQYPGRHFGTRVEETIIEK